MRHPPIATRATPAGTPPERIEQSPDELGEGFLDTLKAFLECRSRGIEPPPPLVEAWDHFYGFYAPRLQAFLKRAGLTEADRNDCFQDVWKEVVAGLGRFHHDPSRGLLSTWLMTLARHKAADLNRRRSRHPAERLAEDDAHAPLDPGLDPAAEYERRRTQDQVRRVLADLSGQVSQLSFQVLYLRWIEGWPTTEVADALDLSPRQVRFRTSRMKRKFRELFQRSNERDSRDEDPNGLARNTSSAPTSNQIGEHRGSAAVILPRHATQGTDKRVRTKAARRRVERN
jgi:RNA polymerase sigma factor (sigma-70 family)